MGTRSLRILHVTPYSADAWAYGGIPRLVESLTRGLARLGHQITVCTTDACDEAARLPKREATRSHRFHTWPPFRTADGVELRVFPNISNRLAYHLQLFLPLGLNTYLSEFAGRFDVAHLHACRNLPALAAIICAGGVPHACANGTAADERCRLAKRVFDALIGQQISTARVCGRFTRRSDNCAV